MSERLRGLALQRVVEPGTYGDELGISCAVEIGAAEQAGALQRAVLVEHDPGCGEPRPRQIICQQHAPGSVFAEVEHVQSPVHASSTAARSRRCRANTPMNCGSVRVSQTEAACPRIQIASPGIQIWRPMPTAAASGPTAIAIAHGAPPSTVD